jgi:hypothetical protein
VRELSRCKQITLAIAMILLLPILIGLAISICLLCCILGAGIAAIISPFYFLSLLCTENNRSCELKVFLFIILVVVCPLVIAISAVVAFFAILIQFSIQGSSYLVAYVTCICFLFHPGDIEE